MANDTTLWLLGRPTGWTVYTRIRNSAGLAWNGTTYATFSTASWSSFATATPETPSGSGDYACAFPTSSPAGSYVWTHYLQAGGSPASTDVGVGGGADYWNGTTFGSVGTVSLPPTPPAGYGNLSGSGSIVVTQDYGGTGNLSAIDSLGNGIGGATVTAFLASDYATNGRNATPLAQVQTTASGQWATGMLLAAGTYVFLFSDRGHLANPATVTVA